MKYFVKFGGQSQQEAFDDHFYGGYDSIDEAVNDTFLYEKPGTHFSIFDETGEEYGDFVVGDEKI